MRIFKKRAIIYFILAGIILSWPFFGAQAQTGGVVPCKGPDCTVCDIFTMIANIIDILVKYIMLPLAGLLFVASGIMMAMGGASEEWYKKGKTSLVNTAIGVAIVLISWVAINTIVTVFVNSGDVPDSGKWYQIKCD